MEDGSSPLWGCIVLGLFIIINSIFHAFESALDNVRTSELEKKAENGDRKAQKILQLLDHPVKFQESMHTAATLIGLVAGYIGIGVIIRFVFAAYEKQWQQWGLSEFTVMTVLAILIMIAAVVLLMAFGYLVPKKIGKHHPEKTLFRYYGLIYTIMICFSPILWIVNITSNLVVRLFGIDPHSDEDEVTEEEIISMVDEAHEQGVLLESEAEMIQNIFEFDETMVRDIMTHRKNIIALDGNMFLDEALRFMLEESYSRYPVYEGDIDNIIGIIHLKDAMKQMTFGQMGNIAICDIPHLIRTVEFVPETRSINRVFQYMQNKKAHMVIVVDEYGQTSGLAAMEDILEEIVGNIQDEYDDDENFIVHQFDDSILMDGLTPLKQVSEVLQTDFMNEDYETLNGYLTSLLDHIPNEDDTEVCDKGFSFQILKIENHIIQKVRVERTAEDENKTKKEMKEFKGDKTCQDIQNSQT